MATTDQATTRQDPRQHAEACAERLRAALARAGVRLPSLRAGACFANFPHVELGGCHADLADQLAAWIEEHAESGR
ncbi:MAG: hypothetical protein ACRDP3_25460 [Streptomyces sp.]|uniref:hypothetical protein n=1 Tax=Streptomyces sp. TaxID=1931 RepID=UPI003D6BC446